MTGCIISALYLASKSLGVANVRLVTSATYAIQRRMRYFLMQHSVF
jgi:hypothetical protein